MPFRLLPLPPSPHTSTTSPLKPDSLRSSWPSSSSRRRTIHESMMAVITHPLPHLVLLLLAVFAASSAALHNLHGSEQPAHLHHEAAARRQASSPSENLFSRQDTDMCASTSTAANPIAQLYPTSVTGVINATIAVLPIPMDLARRLIPARYAILERPLRAQLPNFPEGMYPVLLQAVHDHDIQLAAFNVSIPDFLRFGFEFPFLDLLSDGHSSFRWAPEQLISSHQTIAISGSRDYGTVVHPTSFDPSCDALKPISPSSSCYTHSFAGTSVESSTSISLEVAFADATMMHYPLAFFKNVTNQPTFANGSVCNSQVRLYNSTFAATGQTSDARPVQGKLSTVNVGPFVAGDAAGSGKVEGISVTTAFIENVNVDCQTLQGYQGTGGPGDSDV